MPGGDTGSMLQLARRYRWGTAGVLLPMIVAFSHKLHASRKLRLADLLPHDLDGLPDNQVVLAATGVQLLLFGGFELSPSHGWVRTARHPPTTLAERLERITPTWKTAAGHGVSYEWPAAGESPKSAPLSLFAAACTLPEPAQHATTVRALCRALEDDFGLSAQDFEDAQTRSALREMLRWRVASSEPVAWVLASRVKLFVLSFDATRECRSLADCPKPGPSNELLAATAIRFAEARREHVDVIAQWEVAAAMAQRGAVAKAVGKPGVFENTGEIFDYMFDELVHTSEGVRDCGQPDDETQLVLLAHPDHLPRALSIGQTMLDRRAAAAG
eukprot:6913546-Prymnesium_polylepis.1